MHRSSKDHKRLLYCTLEPQRLGVLHARNLHTGDCSKFDLPGFFDNQSVAQDGPIMRPPKKETCILVEILRLISTGTTLIDG
jgi:hypothetical protein